MKIPKYLMRACRMLRKNARYRTACFTPPPNVLIPNPAAKSPDENWRRPTPEEWTKLVRDTTELFTESWIVPIIDAVERGDTRTLEYIARGELGEEVGPR